MAKPKLSLIIPACFFLFIVGILSHDNAYFTSSLNLYISDQNSTSIFNHVGKGKDMIGILFTNKFCGDCFINEKELQKMIDHLWKEERIKIYRSEISTNEALQQEFGIKRFPMLHYVIPYQASYMIYRSYAIVALQAVKKTINRIKCTLNQNQLSQYQRKNALFIDQSKLIISQQSQLIEHYSLNAVYQNLPNLIFWPHKQLKNMLVKDEMIESDATNCIIYWRAHKKCFSPATKQELAYILSVINFEQVIEFTEQTYKIYQELALERYIFIAVLDSIFDRGESSKHLRMLNGLLQRREFHSKITIFWMQVQINKQKLRHLGFKQTDHPPLFSMFDLSGAPKKILTNRKGEPIFKEQAIVDFIKNIIKFDESEDLLRWNQQLLEESLQRLKISQQFKFIPLKHHKINAAQYFILSFPVIEYELLGDSKIFYRMILNYRYMIERINRFIDKGIYESYLTFDKFYCSQSHQHGLFYVKENVCYQISSKVMFEQEKAAKIIEKHFDLPEFFWINEDQLEEYLFENYNQITESDFVHFYI